MVFASAPYVPSMRGESIWKNNTPSTIHVSMVVGADGTMVFSSMRSSRTNFYPFWRPSPPLHRENGTGVRGNINKYFKSMFCLVQA